MTHYSDGARRERQVRDHMAAAGWTPIMKAGGSKGPADLLLGHPLMGGALVQVGSRSKSIGPADRARFLKAADLIGALAILAVVIPRQGITYWQVNAGPARGWDHWSPQTGSEVVA